MRIMLWSLLALNGVAALLWIVGVSVPPASRPAVAPPTLTAKRLELLSELPSPPARLAAPDDALPPPIAPTDEAMPAAARDGDAPQADAASTPAVGVAPAPSDAPVAATGASGAAASTQVDTGASAVGAASPSPPAVNEPPPAPKQVPPLAQAPENAAPVPVGAEPSPNAAAAAPGAGATCFRTAEFASDAKERVEAALRAAGFGQAKLKSSVRPHYWVYWSGTPGAAAGVEQALKTAGVRDWYRVGGAREAVLSLGVYGQADGARRRQSQLAAKGVETTVAERYAAAARLRWQISASPAAVESAQAVLQRQGVSLAPCP